MNKEKLDEHKKNNKDNFREQNLAMKYTLIYDFIKYQYTFPINIIVMIGTGVKVSKLDKQRLKDTNEPCMHGHVTSMHLSEQMEILRLDHA